MKIILFIFTVLTIGLTAALVLDNCAVLPSILAAMIIISILLIPVVFIVGLFIRTIEVLVDVKHEITIYRNLNN